MTKRLAPEIAITATEYDGVIRGTTKVFAHRIKLVGDYSIPTDLQKLPDQPTQFVCVKVPVDAKLTEFNHQAGTLEARKTRSLKKIGPKAKMRIGDFAASQIETIDGVIHTLNLADCQNLRRLAPSLTVVSIHLDHTKVHLLANLRHPPTYLTIYYPNAERAEGFRASQEFSKGDIPALIQLHALLSPRLEPLLKNYQQILDAARLLDVLQEDNALDAATLATFQTKLKQLAALKIQTAMRASHRANA